MCCTPYTALMVKNYFRKVRLEQLELMNGHRIEAMERQATLDSSEVQSASVDIEKGIVKPKIDVNKLENILVVDEAVVEGAGGPVSLEEIRQSRARARDSSRAKIGEQLMIQEQGKANMMRANASNLVGQR